MNYFSKYIEGSAVNETRLLASQPASQPASHLFTQCMRHVILELVGQSISEVIEDQSVKLHKSKQRRKLHFSWV